MITKIRENFRKHYSKSTYEDLIACVKKSIKKFIIMMNLILGFMIFIAVWDTAGILFIKIRMFLVLNIIILVLFFLSFFKKGVKKTITFWLTLLVVLLITLIYLCDLSLSAYFIRGEGSLLYAILIDDRKEEIFLTWMKQLDFDRSLLEGGEVPKKIREIFLNKK